MRDTERGWGEDAGISGLVEKIRNFPDEDSCWSLKTINIKYGIRVTTLHRIIHDDLKMRNICAKVERWVHIEAQKEIRIVDKEGVDGFQNCSSAQCCQYQAPCDIRLFS